jgi:hypothetical protein
VLCLPAVPGTTTSASTLGSGGANGAGGGTNPGTGLAGTSGTGSSAGSTTGSNGGINPNAQMTSLVATTNTHTLQYAQGGYVSFAAKSGNVIPHTANAGQCALACQRDPNCVAWTRVAGAQPCLFWLAVTRPYIGVSRALCSESSDGHCMLHAWHDLLLQHGNTSACNFTLRVLILTGICSAAGGSKDVQSCHLKYSLDTDSSSSTDSAGSSSPGSSGTRSAASSSTTLRQSGSTGKVQYTQPAVNNRQILESGTKDPNALPASLYGCPYPASSGGGCKPPPSCNCYSGVCYGSC